MASVPKAKPKRRSKPKPPDAARSAAAAAVGSSAARPFVVVVEGDSWEHLPDLGLKSLPIVGGANSDLSRALADRGHTVHNIAYWGDTIADIRAAGDYMRVLKHTRAPNLLLGGGGNDLLGGGRLKTYLRLYAPDREPRDYVLDGFYLDLRRVILDYEEIIARIAADRDTAGVGIVVHGYDYPQAMRLGWIGDPFEFVGIGYDRPDLQKAIIEILIDALNAELAGLARRRRNVRYLDFRNRVAGRWHDELHPSREVFSELAGLVEAAFA